MRICLLLLAICFSTSVIARPIWEPDNNYALANSLRYAAVRIECQSTNGASVGTGVFFAFAETNGLVVPVIVTCKHRQRSTDRKTRLSRMTDSYGTWSDSGWILRNGKEPGWRVPGGRAAP